MGGGVVNLVVTVLMSVYNERPEFLEQAVNSIIAQTFQDWEFLVLDDGSEVPATIGVLQSFPSRDNRIRVLTQPHRGLTKTLNVGLSLARGELVCRQDSDDWSEQDRLERQVDFMRSHPDVAVVGSAIITHQENGKFLWPVLLPRTAQEVRAYYPNNPFCHGATCFRRSAARTLGGYSEILPCAQDYDLFWRMCDTYAGANLAEALYHLRYTSGSVSTLKAEEQNATARVICAVAIARRAGLAEDYVRARAELEAQGLPGNSELLGRLKTQDRGLLAGHHRSALRGFAAIVLQHPGSRMAWLKLIRCLLYISLPGARRRFFIR
jgi:glycosyltransferase involved in cell wall biosynthesis